MKLLFVIADPEPEEGMDDGNVIILADSIDAAAELFNRKAFETHNKFSELYKKNNPDYFKMSFVGYTQYLERFKILSYKEFLTKHSEATLFGCRRQVVKTVEMTALLVPSQIIWDAT